VVEARRRQPMRRFAYIVRDSLRFVRGKRPRLFDQEHRPHLLWELVAVK